MEVGALVEIIKGVFGLPDAPRAWWLEFSGTLLRDFGFVNLKLDLAYFVWRDPQRNALAIMIIVHVDNIACMHDGSRRSK